MSLPLTPENLAPLLRRLCDTAARETLPRFRQNTSVINKSDDGFDPVTEADRAAEAAIRREILNIFPDHAVLGEEEGESPSGSDHMWIIDPIDGTRAFVAGLPVWGTLIGLYVHGRPVAGVMHQPFTGEMYLCDGETSLLEFQGQQRLLETRKTEALSGATLYTTDARLFDREEGKRFSNLAKACPITRFGTDCYAYCMVASGQGDLVVESGLAVYDIAALIPIIEKAGGRVTDWEGGPASQGGRVLAAANGKIHAEALAALAG